MSVRSFRAGIAAFMLCPCLATVLSACHAGDPNPRSRVQSPAPGTPPAKANPLVGRAVIAHFALDVPSGFELVDVSPRMADFALYELVDREKNRAICRIYVGNSPAFPSLQWSGSPKVLRQPRRKKREFRATNRIEGRITFSGLSYKGSAGTPFSTIHYFADALSETNLQSIDQLIESIAVMRTHIE